jgi:DNA-binding IclR family transcriptional regulator
MSSGAQVRTPEGQQGKSYAVPAVARAMAILAFLAKADKPYGVTKIAREVGLPKSSCFAILLTLEDEGYVRRTAETEWVLTLRLYYVAVEKARGVALLREAESTLHHLRDITGLTTHLAVVEGVDVFYAMKVDGPGHVRFVTHAGRRVSLHLTAVGRAIAAFLDDDTLSGLLHGYEFTGGTETAIASANEFAQALVTVRSAGYALEEGEEMTGVGCIAAPIVDHRGSCRSAIGVTFISSALDRDRVEEVARMVVDAAQSLGARLGA